MSAPEHAVHNLNANRDEILTRLQGLLKDTLKLESTAPLTLAARFREDLNMDSLAMVDIILVLEDGFGLRLPSDMNVLGNMRTIGDVVDLIVDVSQRAK